MSVCPIDTGRYGREPLKKIFTEEGRIERLLKVEATIAKTHAEIGIIPKEAAQEIEKKASLKYVKIERIKEIEKEIHHETMAMVLALAEQCGKYGGYVHLGLTSSDALDTALAIQIKDALKIIEGKLEKLILKLVEKALKYKSLPMIGRTHGQHAIPITLGFKFALFASEFHRHYERLQEIKSRILVGKISGATGTFAALGKKGILIQKRTLEKLGLGEPLITTQIIQRDRHAELIFLLALIGTSLDKLATEIRNLQRTEISEVSEPFNKQQIGSSTMPQKRNPTKSERITSLSRLLRSMVYPSLENIVTWHERDLTNSANERFTVPESFILLDEMLTEMIEIIEKIKVNKEKIKENLHLTKGLVMSERIMMALTKKGMGRQEAHQTLRKIALKSVNENKEFRITLLQDKEIKKKLTRKEIDELLNPETYTGLAEKVIERTIQAINNSLNKKRGEGLGEADAILFKRL